MSEKYEKKEKEEEGGVSKPPRLEPSIPNLHPDRMNHPLKPDLLVENEDPEAILRPHKEERKEGRKKFQKGMKDTAPKLDRQEEKSMNKKQRRDIKPQLPKPRYETSHRKKDPDWEEIHDLVKRQDKNHELSKQQKEDIEVIKDYLKSIQEDKEAFENEVLVIYDPIDGSYKVLLRRDDMSNTEGNVTTAEQRVTGRMNQFTSVAVRDNISKVFIANISQEQVAQMRQAMHQAPMAASPVNHAHIKPGAKK